MRRLISTAVFACLATFAMAQSEPMVIHGDGFQTAGAMHLDMGGPDDMKQVKGIPLAADVVNTHVQYLADGNKITNEETSHFYRDGEGRTRRENKLMLPGNPSDAPTMIMINDPVAHTHFVLNTAHKSADQMSSPARMETNMVYVRKQHDEQMVKHGEVNDSAETKEDLGTQTIDGFLVKGTKATHVIPAGKIGNEKPITVTTESWYSDDLGMEIMRVHKDPWSGEVTTKVTNVRRGEQEASLFTPPADFKVQKGGNVIRLDTKDGAELPPPPPQD